MNPISIYVHIPFCVQKCSYCDFLSFPCSETEYHSYFKALENEIESIAGQFDQYCVTSVFFGGGTPTITPPQMIIGVFNCIKEKFKMDSMAEVSIEANPGTVSFDQLKAFKAAGFNRISFGVQSFQNRLLKLLNRIYTIESFYESYQLAIDAGFQNINLDLIFDLPTQTLEEWEESLNKAVALRPAHISAYSLILEQGTALFDMVEAGAYSLPGEDSYVSMDQSTQNILAAAGYGRYEISNYAIPGMECRHNKVYWETGDYIGFGLGAHSCYEFKRIENTKDFNVYIENADADKTIHPLSLFDRQSEFMFLGLRMLKGINEEIFFQRFGDTLSNVYGEQIDMLVAKGLLCYEKGWLHLTENSMNISNQVFACFV